MQEPRRDYIQWMGSYDLPHPQAERVMRTILPAAMARYLEKCGDYGDDPDDEALMGQYFQMKKRMRKLRRVLVEGKTLSGETSLEVLEDFIADIALTIDYLKEADAPDSSD